MTCTVTRVLPSNLDGIVKACWPRARWERDGKAILTASLAIVAGKDGVEDPKCRLQHEPPIRDLLKLAISEEWEADDFLQSVRRIVGTLTTAGGT